MVEKKEVLDKKLETVKKQLNRNFVIEIIAILILVFVPWIRFENFMFKISLDSIIALVILIVCIVRGFSLRSKKEDIETDLSFYSEPKMKPKFFCEYCNAKFKSKEELNKHYVRCEVKSKQEEKDNEIGGWVVGLLFFFGLAIYFLINNKINLIPLFLIGFIITPFFDRVFKWYKKKNKKLKNFEFDWWKKAILIAGIVLVFILINLIIP